MSSSTRNSGVLFGEEDGGGIILLRRRFAPLLSRGDR